MSSPPALRLWVGTLVVMLVAELPGALQKCIFDEVQAQVRVVRAARIHPHGPPDEPTPAPPTGPRHQRSSLGEMTPSPPAPPRPIRIHTWIPRESDHLSDAEKGRLGAAVEEAVRVVSSLLSCKKTHTHTHTHTHTV